MIVPRLTEILQLFLNPYITCLARNSLLTTTKIALSFEEPSLMLSTKKNDVWSILLIKFNMRRNI